VLSEAHELGEFDSGRPELDEWLVKHALGAGARRTARTFIWHRGDRVVVACYSLSAHLLQREELPRALGHGAPPLADALERVLAATGTVAARFVVVDAIDENAPRFYEHHGFRQIPGTRRLVQKVSDVAAALG